MGDVGKKEKGKMFLLEEKVVVPSWLFLFKIIS